MNSRIDSLDMHSSVFHGPCPGAPPPLAPPGVVGAVSSETLWARMQLLWAGSEAQLVLVAGVGRWDEEYRQYPQIPQREQPNENFHDLNVPL